MPTRTPGAVEEQDALDVPPAAWAVREPRSLSPDARLRRAIALLVMALLVPGTAQLTAGNRRVGRVLVRAWAGVVGVGVLIGLLALISRSLVLSLLTSPVMLMMLATGCFVAAFVLPLSLGDAWRLGRVGLLPPRPRAAISAAAVVLMVLSCVGMIGLGRRLWAGADLIRGVFGSGVASSASDGRYNVLLLGGDAGPDRVGTRPDSMTLASIDESTGRTVLFSLPRNLEDVPFAPGSAADRAMPDGWSCGDECLLNGIYTWGQEHRAVFPGVSDPGAEAMKQAVQGITGLHVNYYVLIDLRGFSQLIDALGGIRVDVTQRVPIGGGTSKVSGYIEPGTQTLNGYHALWFARSRHGASDYERMARQRCVMDAMVHQLDPATVLSKFQGIAQAGKQVVSTDIPAGELGTFLDLAAKAKSQKISSVQFVPPVIDPARPDMGLIKDKVAAAVEAAEKGPDAAEKDVAEKDVAEKDVASPGAAPSNGAASRDGAAAPGSSPATSEGSGGATGASAETGDITAVCHAA